MSPEDKIAGAAPTIGEEAKRTQTRWAIISLGGVLFVLLVAAGQFISSVSTIISTADTAYRKFFNTSASQPLRPLSVIVLPFQNNSDDKNQDYFVDGLTEGLTNAIGQAPGLFVISANTAFSLRGKRLDSAAISKELGVRYVLEGGIVKDGPLMRVTAGLTDGATGALIWTDRFDRQVDKTLNLQDAIVTRVSNSIGVKIVENEAARLQRAGAAKPDALEFTLKGIAVSHKPQSKETLEEARKLLENAVSLDAGSAEAHAWLARTYLRLFNDFHSGDQDLLRLAENAATQAVAVAPNYWFGYLALANVRFGQKKVEAAVEAVNTCVTLNPNASECLAYRGYYQHEIGKADLGAPDLLKAIELDPRSPFLWRYQFQLGDTYLYQGDFGHAVEWLEKAAAGNPKYVWSHLYLAASYALAGRQHEGRGSLSKALALTPSLTLERFRSSAHSTNSVYLSQRERIAGALQTVGLQ